MINDASRIARLSLRDGFGPVPSFVDQILADLLASEPMVLDLTSYQHDEWIDLYRLACAEEDRR